MEITWKLRGMSLETEGVPGGEWQLTQSSRWGVYILCPVGSCRGIEIAADRDLPYILATANALITEARS